VGWKHPTKWGGNTPQSGVETPHKVGRGGTTHSYVINLVYNANSAYPTRRRVLVCLGGRHPLRKKRSGIRFTWLFPADYPIFKIFTGIACTQDKLAYIYKQFTLPRHASVYLVADFLQKIGQVRCLH
jgi:hypothetical protein